MGLAGRVDDRVPVRQAGRIHRRDRPSDYVADSADDAPVVCSQVVVLRDGVMMLRRTHNFECATAGTSCSQITQSMGRAESSAFDEQSVTPLHEAALRPRRLHRHREQIFAVEPCMRLLRYCVVMHLTSLSARAFKRFSDLHVKDLSGSARLIILAGPNGSGKSSFFDAVKTWHWNNGAYGSAYDGSYHDKVGADSSEYWANRVSATVDEDLNLLGVEDRKKLVYVRSAHRNEADFTLNGLTQLPSPLDSSRVQRMIDNDMSVSQNYQRLIVETFTAVFDVTASDTTTRLELRDAFIGKVRDSLNNIYPDLILNGISSNPLESGTFSFTKGSSTNFSYKNLSAGEKAAFDLILDVVISGRYYDRTIWCIDEPETHLNVRVQGALLDQLLFLLPPACQLILASHSLGFMRRAWEMSQQDPAKVQFLDFEGRDFDQTVTMTPEPADRAFWNRTLDVAMGDLAALVAPEQVVLCEGRPASTRGKSTKSEFDASCYRKIFAAELPNTDFISIGNNDDVKNDKLELGKSISAISTGTKIIKVVDRDLLNEDEVAGQISAGVQVLGRRNIEAYLLDDEIIRAFALNNNADSTRQNELIAKRDELLKASVLRDNDPDDLKSIAGEWYNFARKQLQITAAGSNWEAFAVNHLAPCIAPTTDTYADLKRSIFG